MDGSGTELKKRRLWARFTPQELALAGAVLAIFLIGLAARWWPLRHERPETYRPAGIETVE